MRSSFPSISCKNVEYFFGIIIWNTYGLHGYIAKMINKFKGKFFFFFLHFENSSFSALRICNAISASLDLICRRPTYVPWTTSVNNLPLPHSLYMHTELFLINALILYTMLYEGAIRHRLIF